MYYIARTSHTFLPCFITLPFLLHFFSFPMFFLLVYMYIVQFVKHVDDHPICCRVYILQKELVILTTVLVISVADMPGGDSYNILCFTMSNHFTVKPV